MTDLPPRVDAARLAVLPLVTFLHRQKLTPTGTLPAVSLFSGAGISDSGYEQAGFRFHVQAELDPNRATLCGKNFASSNVVPGTLAETGQTVISTYEHRGAGRLQLMSITPPCQGMSSSNPGRGKLGNPQARDERNRLLLDSAPLIRALRPRIFVVENVMQVLKETIPIEGTVQRVVALFTQSLPEYRLFTGVVQMADYGVPQVRKRAVLVGIHQDEACLPTLYQNNSLPWPRPTHAEVPTAGKQPWVTLNTWLTNMNYPVLDARNTQGATDPNDPLHFVTVYDDDRYYWVADIPPWTGRNAYQNANCRACGRLDVPENVAYCPSCGAPMTNRPCVVENGTYRLVKGFASSYRRMYPDRPAATITTASSHLGSDYKIHPWEHRVLSVRECADLQTVPRFYNWEWALQTQHTYLARQVIGEALPPWFTYLHGQLLKDLLAGHVNPAQLASGREDPAAQGAPVENGQQWTT